MIKVLATDIDGVLTDGKAYISGGIENKTICYSDLDAFGDIRGNDIKIAIITGEENDFTEFIRKKVKPDFFYSGCKSKGDAIQDIMLKADAARDQICYIGDGKYDIPAMKIAGISVCPADAIDEAKVNADIILKKKGGEGCIAELSPFLCRRLQDRAESTITNCILEHRNVLNKMLYDETYINELTRISEKVVECYRNGGKLLLCGNGGSAADAQHLAAELVSRLYTERKALSAEALSANTSIITAIGNDYDYSRVFARAVEAQGRKGDILIGITTSGKSANIIEAFKAAHQLELETVLFTGTLENTAEIIGYTDYLLSVPSKDTPRIQEIHILLGHIMCEIVESKIFNSEEVEDEQE